MQATSFDGSTPKNESNARPWLFPQSRLYNSFPDAAVDKIPTKPPHQPTSESNDRISKEEPALIARPRRRGDNMGVQPGGQRSNAFLQRITDDDCEVGGRNWQ